MFSTMSLILLLSLLSIILTYSFNIPKSQGIRSNRYITASKLIFNHKFSLYATDTENNSWKIDEDTSELDVQSSAGLARKKAAEEAARLAAAEAARLEAARLEAAKLEAEKALALEKELSNKSSNQVATTPIVTTPIPPIAASVSSTAVTANTIASKEEKDTAKLTPGEKKTAFDIGLILVFPLMVGTLLLFLFFPLIGAQLAASSSSTSVPSL